MRVVCLMLLLSLPFLSYGQDENGKLSIAPENKTIAEILDEIEQKTDYRFYYAEQWLDTTAVSKRYNSVSVAEILEDIFKDTDINFFIS